MFHGEERAEFWISFSYLHRRRLLRATIKCKKNGVWTFLLQLTYTVKRRSGNGRPKASWKAATSDRFAVLTRSLEVSRFHEETGAAQSATIAEFRKWKKISISAAATFGHGSKQQ